MLLVFYSPQRLRLECLNFAHTVYLRIPYASDNKQTLFPSTAFADWSFEWKYTAFSARYEPNLYL